MCSKNNGFEFTNRFANYRREIHTRFELTAEKLGIQHKFIRPYMPWHSGKAEHSHREDQKRFYDSRRFYLLSDFAAQFVTHLNCSNNFPMRLLDWFSPRKELAASSLFDYTIWLTNLH